MNTYQPIESFDENKEIIDWLNSEDFFRQITEGNFDFIERGRLINSVSAYLININAIECSSSNEEILNYYIELTLKLIYKFKDGAETAEEIDVGLDVNKVWDESIYMLENAYRVDGD